MRRHRFAASGNAGHVSLPKMGVDRARLMKDELRQSAPFDEKGSMVCKRQARRFYRIGLGGSRLPGLFSGSFSGLLSCLLCGGVISSLLFGPALCMSQQPAAPQAGAFPDQSSASREQGNPGAMYSTLDVLAGMEARAGAIFAGEVVAIRRTGQEGRAGAESGGIAGDGLDSATSGMVEVEVRVDDAIRGCSAGSHYVLREWPGLWLNKSPRYRVGERALWMLYPPNAAGLSSPVGGMAGVVPLSGRGRAMVADLRWVQTRVARAPALPWRVDSRPDTARTPPVEGGHSVAINQFDQPPVAYAALLQGLRSMEGSGHAAQ